MSTTIADSDRLTRLNSQFSNLRQLPENWDSYGAKPIKPEVLAFSFELIERLVDDETPMPSIVPMPSGNIQLEWHINNIDLEVQVLSQTSVSVFYENLETGEEWEGELHHDLDKLTELIHKISAC